MSVYTTSSTGRGVVSCDWITFSCKLGRLFDGDTLPVPDGWLCLAMAPTAVWGKRFFIMDREGNKVATWLSNPRTPKIPAVSCNIQIANRWLYYEDFHNICDKIFDMLPLAVCGLNRVDLCCDFEMTEELYGTYLALAKKEARLKALHDSVSWWKQMAIDETNGKKVLDDVPNQVNWGGVDSTFKWKVYYKWYELQTAPPEEKKPWIIDLWRSMGFDERHVWRVEVSINNTNSLRSLDGVKIKPFEWFDNRVQLFSDIYADKFIVRRKEGHKDRRNDTIMPFLEVSGSKSVKHALPVSSREGSDPEKRIVCKIWQELHQGDTRCNARLSDMLRRQLRELLESPSNVWVIQKMYGVDFQAIVDCVSDIDMPPE